MSENGPEVQNDNRGNNRKAAETSEIKPARSANVHKGHRERTKKKVISKGIDILNDHQILEVLLFFALPQKDTNEIAHDLLNRFDGSLIKVVNADYNELRTVKGIGDNAACFFVVLREFARKYLIDSYTEEHLQLVENTDEQCELFRRVFLGSSVEEIYAAAFNDDLELMCIRKLSEGGFDKAMVSPRMLIEFAINAKSNRIIIAHNHPNGSMLPSLEDISVTGELVSVMKSVDVDLLDHIVVGSEGAFSIRSSLYARNIWMNET